jgi:hypothetical protein
MEKLRRLRLAITTATPFSRNVKMYPAWKRDGIHLVLIIDLIVIIVFESVEFSKFS